MNKSTFFFSHKNKKYNNKSHKKIMKGGASTIKDKFVELIKERKKAITDYNSSRTEKNKQQLKKKVDEIYEFIENLNYNGKASIEKEIEDVNNALSLLLDTREFSFLQKLNREIKFKPKQSAAKIAALLALLYGSTKLQLKDNNKKEKEKEKEKEEINNILNAIEKDAEVFNKLDNKYKKNKEFCLKAILRNKDIFKYIPKEFLKSEDYLIELLKTNPEVFDLILNSENKNLKDLFKNKNFIKKIKETKKKSLISQINNMNPISLKKRRGVFL